MQLSKSKDKLLEMLNSVFDNCLSALMRREGEYPLFCYII